MLKTLLLAIPVALTEASELKSVASPRELMVEAIDAPDGAARGVLVGELADEIARAFTHGAPLKIEVSTLKRYRQAGCRRLNVRFTADPAALSVPDGEPPKPIDFGIDYCRDGRPPSSRTESKP
ncbi:hypothetical protein E7V67_009870 [[Empedobacter] haloabium]|uniref:Uncharacterized protein n=1 Tax=[Empedobacter] haloabium TaxID=592317 RepID=A0ABZ1URQ0_9BURK